VCVVLVFNFTGSRVAPRLLQLDPGIVQFRTETGANKPLSQRKMPGFKPGIGTIPEYGRELLKGHFTVPKPDSVTDTQGNPLNTDPCIVPVKKCTVAGARILQENETVIGQFHTGMET